MEDELDYGKVQALQAAQSPEAQEQALPTEEEPAGIFHPSIYL